MASDDPDPSGGTRARDPGEGPRAHEPDLDGLARDAGAAARTLSGAIAGVTLLALHAIVGVFTVSVGTVAPGWVVAALLVVWGGIGAVAWRWRQRRPIAAMLAPFVTAAIVLTSLALGSGTSAWGD